MVADVLEASLVAYALCRGSELGSLGPRGKPNMDTESSTHRNERDERPDLLRQMTAEATEVTKQSLLFRNNDVPKFLQELDRFEKRSRESKRMIL